MAGVLSIVLFVVTLIGVLLSPWIIYVIAPGYVEDDVKFDLTTLLLRIVFPYIFLISLSSFISAILNTWNRFSIPAFAPVLLNLSIIIGSLFFAPYFEPPILVVAVSVLFGGILQILIQLPSLRKIGMLVFPRLYFQHHGVLRIIGLMIPIIISASAAQISQIINTIFASFLKDGSVSWLYYADRLMEFPVGVIGVALSVILLPSLSKSFVKKDFDKSSLIMQWGLQLCLILALPCAVALFFLSKILILSLFEYGKFDVNDTLMTSNALQAYSLGLVALMLIKLFVPCFYAMQDTKTPFKIALFVLVCVQCMNLIFVDLFLHVGLALSISIGGCINALLLFFQIKKRKLVSFGAGWYRFLFKVMIALLAMSTVLNLLISISDFNTPLLYERLLKLLAICFLSGGSYLLMLYALGFRLKHFTLKPF